MHEGPVWFPGPRLARGAVRVTAALTVRTALPSDAPVIARLLTVLGYPSDLEPVRERLARIQGTTDGVVLVAEVTPGGVVGWLHAVEHDLLESGRRCEILGLVVDADHRQRGVGRQLVGAAEGWARERGLAVIGVRSNVVREESHPFYERLGYVLAKTQHAYRKGLDRETG